jgi:hypothetical protein
MQKPFLGGRVQIQFGVMSVLPFKGRRGAVQRQSISGFLDFAPVAQLLICSEYSERELCIRFEDEFDSRVMLLSTPSKSTPQITEILHAAFEFSKGQPVFYQSSDVLMTGDSENLPPVKEPFLLTGVTLPRHAQIKRLTPWDVYRARMGRDWFYLSHDVWSNLPNFYVGRYFWDDWLIRHAVKSRIMAVDMSEEFRCIDLEADQTLSQRHEHHGPIQLSGPSFIRGRTLANPLVRFNYLVGGYKTGVWSVMAIPRRYRSKQIVRQHSLPFVFDRIERGARAPGRAFLYLLRKYLWHLTYDKPFN